MKHELEIKPVASAQELIDKLFDDDKSSILTNQAARALIARDELLKVLVELAEAQQEYIKAIPDDIANKLPAMPGFDHDYFFSAVDVAKKATEYVKPKVPVNG